MELSFNIVPTKIFEKQLEKADEKEIQKVKEKLRLIKSNPFRFKKLEGYKHIFSVKLEFNSEFSRLIYIVFYPTNKDLTILGIFDRKKSYKDIKRIFKDYLKDVKKK
jgi:hypothetical protein